MRAKKRKGRTGRKEQDQKGRCILWQTERGKNGGRKGAEREAVNTGFALSTFSLGKRGKELCLRAIRCSVAIPSSENWCSLDKLGEEGAPPRS